MGFEARPVKIITAGGVGVGWGGGVTKITWKTPLVMWKKSRNLNKLSTTKCQVKVGTTQILSLNILLYMPICCYR